MNAALHKNSCTSRVTKNLSETHQVLVTSSSSGPAGTSYGTSTPGRGERRSLLGSIGYLGSFPQRRFNVVDAARPTDVRYRTCLRAEGEPEAHGDGASLERAEQGSQAYQKTLGHRRTLVRPGEGGGRCLMEFPRRPSGTGMMMAGRWIH